MASLLAACSNSPTDIVKETYIDDARTLTVANGLSNRALCKSTDWDSFKDEKGRTIVQYKCIIVDGNDFLKDRRQDFLESLTKDAEKDVRHSLSRLASVKKKIEDDYPEQHARIERLQKALEVTQAIPIQRVAETSRIHSLTSQIKDLERDIADRRWADQRELPHAENEVVSAAEKNNPALLKKQSEARHPVYKSSAEIFQWIVNADGHAILTYGELQAIDAAGVEETLIKYNRPDQMLGVAAMAQESKILDYMREIGLASFTGLLGR